MTGDVRAIIGFVLLGTLLLVPFLGGGDVLFPFHTGSLSPWKTQAPEWVEGEPRNFNVGDKHTIIYPDVVFSRSQLDEGRMPLWNPHNFAGVPHQANPLTAVTYPPNVLFSLMDPLRAFALLNALHLVLIALFTFALIRTLGVSPQAAFLGGLGAALSGWVAVHVHHSYFVNTFTWIPLALASVENILRRRNRWSPATLAIAIGMMFTAGFPQTAVIGFYLIGTWCIVGVLVILRRQGPGVAARPAGVLAGFVAIGVLLASIQLLPTLEFKTDVGHQDLKMENLTSDALRPAALTHVLMPDIFGHPTEASVTGGNPTQDFFGRWLLTDDGVASHMSNNYSERTFYFGTLIWVLALGILLVRRDRVTWTLVGAVVVALMLATARPAVLLNIVRHLPGLDFGSPMRFTQILALAAPVLFAMVLDDLLSRTGTPRPRLLRITVWTGVTVIIIGLMAAATLWIAPTWFRHHFADFLVSNGVDQKLGAGELAIEEKRELLTEPVERLRNAVSLALLALAAAWGFILAAARGCSKPRVLFILATIFVVVELGWYGTRFNLPVRREGLYEVTSPGLRFLQDNLGDARFLRFGAGTEQTFLIPNAPLVYGLNDAQGFRAMTPRTYLDFMRTLEDNPFDIGLPNLRDTGSLTRPQLGFLRVKYLVSQTPIPDCPWNIVFPPPESTGPSEMYIYENPRLLPRACLVKKVNVMPHASILSTFSGFGPMEPDKGNPMAGEVWVEELTGGMQVEYAPDSHQEDVRVSLDEPGRIRVETGADVEGVIVLAEQFAPGWQAHVHKGDGNMDTLPVIRANGAFLAVPVERETTSIEFVYAPASFKWGRVISGIAIVFVLLLPLIGSWLDRRRPGNDSETAVPGSERTPTGA